MRAAIYCRVSTPGQKNTTSLPEQERINRAHAAQLGWEVSEAHVYHEVEGGQDLYRPCMDRLWDAIIRHEIDAVVIDVLDRLSRDEGDCGAFYHHCDRYGVTVELASEDIDETENGRNLRTLSGMMGRMERVDIRRRTQRGRKARAAAGKLFTTSFPLYGYLFADGDRARYVEDPETAWVVRRIYQAVADGVPIRTLARQLEADGIPTPGQVLAARGQLPSNWRSSGYWHPGSLLRILHHPAYWGAHTVYRWQMTATKERPVETGITRKVRKRSERASDDPARLALPASTCPALVSADVATRAHARMGVTKAESPGRNVDPLATLWRGLAVCGHCGGRLGTAPASKGQGRRRYVCRSIRGAQGDDETGATRHVCPGGSYSIDASVLDPAGWADVKAWLNEEANVARLLAEWEQDNRSGEQSIGSRVEAADAQLRILRGKMDALAETIAETSKGESRRTLQEKLDRYADQVTAEEKKRERLLQEAQGAVDHAREAHEVREWVRIVATQAATMTPVKQHATLRALGAQLTLWRADYVHPDGWPQRYRIRLHFTGFSGQPTTLPPAVSACIVTPAS